MGFEMRSAKIDEMARTQAATEFLKVYGPNPFVAGLVTFFGVYFVIAIFCLIIGVSSDQHWVAQTIAAAIPAVISAVWDYIRTQKLDELYEHALSRFEYDDTTNA